MPPAPGTSEDLPPGYRTTEDKQRKKRRARWRTRIGALVALLVIGGVVGATLLSGGGSGEKQTVADVAVGECFSGSVNDAEVVACDEDHQFELVAVSAAADPAAAFPGADALLTIGTEACLASLTEYYGAGPEVAAANSLQLDPITPTESQWAGGTTDTFCVARGADGQTLGASIKGQGAAG